MPESCLILVVEVSAGVRVVQRDERKGRIIIINKLIITKKGTLSTPTTPQTGTPNYNRPFTESCLQEHDNDLTTSISKNPIATKSQSPYI